MTTDGKEVMESTVSDTLWREGGIEGPEKSPVQTPQRLGGWLIFLAFGMSLSVLRNLYYCFFSISLLFRQPLWDILTNPASTAYHPYWKPLMIYEAVTNSFFFLISLITLVLFFQRRRIFSKLIGPVIPTVVALSLRGHLWAGSIPKVANSAIHARVGNELILSFIAMHIWIPCFLVSRRVKEAFGRRVVRRSRHRSGWGSRDAAALSIVFHSLRLNNYLDAASS
jgi:Protein of unknown function (DUF2569)